MNIILSGKVLWSHDFELSQSNIWDSAAALFSGAKPFHKHMGDITLTEQQIIIAGDEDLEIPLKNISQLFLGFDENFQRTMVKNFGMFWQPLRVTLVSGQQLYLVIDFNMVWTTNHIWFNALTKILS